MAARAYWKGHIRLSLVSFSVRLHAAITSTEKIALHQYDEDSGERIHYQKVNESGDIVEAEDIIKGYEYEKGQFVPIDDKDLDELKLESKHTIELVQFTNIDDVDPIYFERSYYVAPDGDIAEEAYLTVREALKKSGKAAIGQIVLNNKERIVTLRPCGKGLVLDTLRYAYEVREAENYFESLPQKTSVDKEQMELAEALIEKKSKPFDPKAFKDHYQEGLLDIIEAKLKGKKGKSSGGGTKPSKGKVVDIVSALKASLEQAEGGRKKKSTRKKSSDKAA